MALILALDQGTTSSRAMAFNAHGDVVAQAQQTFTQHFPQPGWVEHDAAEIWQSQLAVTKAVLAELNAKREAKGAKTAIKIIANDAVEDDHAIAAIGITNQRETTVLWDRTTGQPVAPAIVWQDRRTAAACELLRAQGHARRIAQKTGLVLDAYFSATKLQWLLDHVPGARDRAERGELAFGTIDTWLIWNLTGGPNGGIHVTDASNASRTMLFNIHTGEWDAALLRLFNIPASLLPTVVPSSGVIGHTAEAVLGLKVPIAGIAGDQQAATFGQNCFAPGTAKNTYGTGCFMLMNTGTQAVASRHQLLTTVGWQGPADAPHRTAYCLEGSVFNAGATVQWLRDGLGLFGQSADIEALAASVPDTGDVYLVPALTGLGAPDWDGRARGTVLGLTRGSTRAHIARAALEAIALQVADVFEAMQRDSGIALQALHVDGGASQNNLLMQIQADCLGVPVLRPRITESTAWGAAALAGLAVGVWPDAAALSATWQLDRQFEPRWNAAERQAKLSRWRQAVARSRHWAQDAHA